MRELLVCYSVGFFMDDPQCAPYWISEGCYQVTSWYILTVGPEGHTVKMMLLLYQLDAL